MTAPLLVEVQTEELPVAAVRYLAREFPRELFRRLRGGGFTDEKSKIAEGEFATPRRFAAIIEGVRGRTLVRAVTKRGPQVRHSFQSDGSPTRALRGFMRSVGAADISKLSRAKEKEREYVVWRGKEGGERLCDEIAPMVCETLAAISDLPEMHWCERDYKFVRPVVGATIVQGARAVLSGQVMGRDLSGGTFAHPLHSRKVRIPRAADYRKTLREKGHVIVEYGEREKMLRAQLQKAADKLQLRWETLDAEKLLREVVAMCEWPVVVACELDKVFSRLPAFCVAGCIMRHQKCFPLFDKKRRVAGFLFVADGERGDDSKIRAGLGAVVRARLRDLIHYLTADFKLTQKEAGEKLRGITHNRYLGDQSRRAARLQKIAAQIGETMGLGKTEAANLKRAAEICKLDLPTQMVGEYPELAGKMAALYFCEGNAAVAEILGSHASEDIIPLFRDRPSAALFLADRLEKITGMFIIGKEPAGRSDPHGLRRAAHQAADVLAKQEPSLPLGELQRIILAVFVEDFREAAKNKEGKTIFETVDVNKHGDFSGAVAEGVPMDSAYAAFYASSFTSTVKEGSNDKPLAKMHEFVIRRAPLPENAETAILNAVYAVKPDFPAQIAQRHDAVRIFLRREEAPALLAANKRIGNILRKSGAPAAAAFSVKLLREPAEKTLHECLQSLEKKTKAHIAENDFSAALSALAAEAAKPVADFFDNVLVNAEEKNLRNNRLALLARLQKLLNSVADLSHIV